MGLSVGPILAKFCATGTKVRFPWHGRTWVGVRAGMEVAVGVGGLAAAASQSWEDRWWEYGGHGLGAAGRLWELAKFSLFWLSLSSSSVVISMDVINNIAAWIFPSTGSTGPFWVWAGGSVHPTFNFVIIVTIITIWNDHHCDRDDHPHDDGKQARVWPLPVGAFEQLWEQLAASSHGPRTHRASNGIWKADYLSLSC